jgi:hypothetical protein
MATGVTQPEVPSYQDCQPRDVYYKVTAQREEFFDNPI